MKRPMEPATAEEWQTVVDASYAALAMKRAVDYGFITFDGSMTVNVERCEDILKRGAALGYHGRDEAVETLVRGFVAQGGLDPNGEDADVATQVVLSVAHEARA